MSKRKEQEEVEF